MPPPLTSFAEASPAKTSATPAMAPGSPASAAGSGASTPASFAFYDRASWSLKTWQRSLSGGWSECSETLPRAGTMLDGRLYAQPMWGHHTCETGCSSSPGELWPTATVGDASSSGSRNLEGSKAHPGVSLTDKVLMGGSTPPRRWPTASATDHKGVSRPGQRRGQLEEAVRYPGPGAVPGPGMKLNPRWVCALMGFPLGWFDGLRPPARRSTGGSRRGQRQKPPPPAGSSSGGSGTP